MPTPVGLLNSNVDPWLRTRRGVDSRKLNFNVFRLSDAPIIDVCRHNHNELINHALLLR